MFPGVDGLEVGRLEGGRVVVSASVVAVDGVVAVGVHLDPAGDQVGRHQRRVRVLHLKSKVERYSTISQFVSQMSPKFPK